MNIYNALRSWCYHQEANAEVENLQAANINAPEDNERQSNSDWITVAMMVYSAVVAGLFFNSSEHS